MSDGYHELLEATIGHLRDLKAQGVHYVPVSDQTLTLLSLAPRKVSSATARPASTLASVAPKPIAVERPFVPVTKANSPATVSDDASPPPVSSGFSSVEPGPARTVRIGSKGEALETLRARVLQCTKCDHLVAARNSVVFGVGNAEAELMFVGEAPGAEEDRKGEPFVGAAGQLLTKIIQAMGLTRGDVYIANILKCRPDTPGQSFGNRPPTSEEMSRCVTYLHEQIDIIQPKAIVALGAVAVSALLGKTGISRLRGTWHTYRGIPLMPTYHPSFLLRSENQKDKRSVWEDMMAVMERLSIPISEKQRNYFLK